MRDAQERSARARGIHASRVWWWMFLFLGVGGCGRTTRPAAKSAQTIVVRVGVGQVAATAPLAGLRQLVQNQSLEGLVRIGPDGRPLPWLAQDWSVTADRLSLTLHLRPTAKFHDGSAVTAQAVATTLRNALPAFMGPAFEDVGQIESVGPADIEIRFKRPAPFLLEALEASISKPGAPKIGTGPFMADPLKPNELHANVDYYLGPPSVSRIVMKPYPSVRAAWADMLRDNVDMLYEVGPDALSSMQDTKTASLFSFTRPYQYVVVLNTRSKKLHDAAIRRALNRAIDRGELIREAFDSHGTPSSGPVWPSHWAANGGVKLTTNAQLAAKTLQGSSLQFICLVPPDYERVALVVKRQLAAIGVEMELQQVSPDVAMKAMSSNSFEAVLLDGLSGPSLLRPYEVWHKGGSMNPGAIGSPAIDVALDRIRYAASDAEYRAAVSNFQQVAIEDPPAIFLAWGERARAVSKRFVVPMGDPGRDVLASLRLWRPATAAEQRASRN
jgi:peptide/nickel transport system substrate-binding protein